MFGRKVIGRCSICGGIVSVPTVYWSVIPPVPTCESCGAVEDSRRYLPLVPMKPRDNNDDWKPRKTYEVWCH